MKNGNKINSSKKVLCLLAALLIAAGSVGCSTPKNANGGSGQQTQSTNRDPLAPFEEPVTIRTVLTAHTPPTTVEDSNMKPEDMLFVKVAKEKYNINVEFMWSVPEEQFEQKLSVTLAAGDLPDVLNVKTEIYEQLKENDLLLDLNPSMDLFYPELKDMLNRAPETLDIFVEEDGRRLGIPQYWDPRRSLIQMGIRQDWLDQLGLSVPTTVAELSKVMEAFTTQDPDGNGKADTFGIALNKMNPTDALGDRGMGGLFNMFGAYPKYWIDDGTGKLQAGEVMSQCKDALTWINAEYVKGTLDKEFITKDTTKLTEEMANNRYGIYFSHWWYPGSATFNSAMTNAPDATWTFAQIPGVDGPGKSVVNRNTIEQVFVATEKCVSTDAYVKLMNISTMLETDPQAHFGMDKSEVEKTRVWNWESPFFFFDPMDIENENKKVNEAFKTGSTDGLNTAMLQELEGFKEFQLYLSGEMGWTGGTAFPTGFGKVISRIWDQGSWAKGAEIYAMGDKALSYNEYFGSATATQKDRGATLLKMTEEVFTKMAVGQQSIDEFDKYVTDWKNLGGESITTEINDWYAANKQ